MRPIRPRTLTGLLIVGFALVALPLIIAVVRAAFAMNQLARESETLVVVGVEATRLSQSLLEQLRDLERGARLYQVLGNPDLLSLYESNQKAFLAELGRLKFITPDEESLQQLAAMRTDSIAIEGALNALAPDSAALTEALTGFERLREGANSVAQSSRQYISSGLGNLREESSRARQTLAWQTAALVPGTLGLIGLFVFLVAKPLRQIDRVIRDLGKGALSRQIKVAGPADLQALGEQLEWLRNRLLELANERNRFLRHMSHELKTPLANIREGTDLLIDGSVGDLSDGQREVAEILRGSGLRLQQDIENLLSYSAWQSRTATLELSNVELKPLVLSVIQQHQLSLAARRVKVKYRIEELYLTADRHKLRMVTDNLMSNAAKFAPADSRIYVRGRQEGESLVLEVADCGPGIRAADESRVFDAFYQGEAPQGGPVKGTGIGLSVVRECVLAHGGRVEIVSGEFPGAHIRVYFPLQQVPDHA
ncbi:MAG: ATP-binding protein [Chromatiales bacterium]|jgi:two-component system sensor histidine kinase GlrK